MARLSGNRVAWEYLADDGNTYRVAAELALVTQGKQGGALAAATVPERPNDFTLRRCTVSNAAGQSRTVVLYAPDAALVTAGTSINANVGDDSATLTSNGGFIPEKHARKNVTKQQT